MFNDTSTSGKNKKALDSLMSQRMMSSLAHSRSMTDLSTYDSLKTGSSLGRYSKSCLDMADQSSLRRNRSYSKITDQQNSLDKKLDSYRSTMTDMFTNVKSFSSRSIAALSSENLLKSIRLRNPTPSSCHSSYQEEDLSLRDPCWRAKRIGVEYQPQQYSWRERLGMQERSSVQSLSRSTPNLAHLGTLGSYRSESVRTTSVSDQIQARSGSHYPSNTAYRDDLGSFTKSCLNINSCNDSTNYMKKALRQLKVATNWLSNSSDTHQRTTDCSRPPIASPASRWSTPASHNRFSHLRARFA